MVSVLIPSFNHAKFLRAAIESVQSQTYKDWEIVLVDDGSTDESLVIAQELASREPRLRVVANEQNLGTYGSLQRALSLAEGKYIAVLNSDDLWRPQKLELQIKAIGDAPFVYCLGEILDERNRPVNLDQHLDWPRESHQDLKPWLSSENRVLASSVVFRREGLSFHTECRYSGDWVALIEASRRGKGSFVNGALTIWRHHENNTFRVSPGQVAEEIAVREAIQSQLGLNVANLLHLTALRTRRGEMAHAKRTAKLAFRARPDMVTFKRLMAVNLPAAVAQKKLWMDTQVVDPVPIPPLHLNI